MVYGVCKECAHTKELIVTFDAFNGLVMAKCDHCGKVTMFRLVVQIEQPDGSVIEVSE